MTDHSREKHGQQHEHHQHVEHARQRPIHHKWGFWAAVLLMLFALGVWFFNMDGSLWPGNPTQQPVPAAP